MRIGLIIPLESRYDGKGRQLEEPDTTPDAVGLPSIDAMLRMLHFSAHPLPNLLDVLCGEYARDRRGEPTMTMHVVLVHPEIHWNTGNAGRTCLAAGATLHLIEPLGFSLDEREVKRAGLDYWEHVEMRVWPHWEAFERELPALGEPFFFSTKSSRLLWDAPLGNSTNVVLVFGRETGGLPDALHERYAARFVGMPILSPRVRSLNLSTSVGIAVYETLRQRRASGAGP